MIFRLSSDGPAKKDSKDGGIEFEGVHIDDDPTASMVVMRRFLFYRDEDPKFSLPTLKVDGLGDNLSVNCINNENSLTKSNKSGRRVTLFEGESIII